ncbi:MAG: type I phosphomannose isomerase catalytic subunit [Bacteroidales bacterium]|nr:mannose-6-phosphate isomerase [Bacteroidales bacterium]HOK98448.1 mannose-6-phosphate isomerase [Bacteroidales bacterium]HPO66129.1 mannose-6-phosphate isomerase [Bacteroidales bacterium]
MENSNSLYPLKFKPILKDVLWGGTKLRDLLHKKGASDRCGESWEISDVPGASSVVANGFLAGNTLSELVEVYMDDLVGGAVFERFGERFPLLIKFIDANDRLSVQVHPNDEMALREHNSWGKTEMWYVVQAEPDAGLIVGFNRPMDAETYVKYLNEGRLEEILHFEKVKAGDVVFLPAGRIHAIGAGLLIAEIQQTSDITYRIYDWNRLDATGKPRELHTELALKAIDFRPVKNIKTSYTAALNRSVELVKCPYFTTNLLEFEQTIEKDYGAIDSFVIYMCLEGKFTIETFDSNPVDVTMGETVLIPAEINNLYLKPQPRSKILEVYIDNTN